MNAATPRASFRDRALASLRRFLPSFAREGATRGAERWVVVDTEGSGLGSGRDRLLAIGGVAVTGDGIVPADSFEAKLGHDASMSRANANVDGSGRAEPAGDDAPVADALVAYRQWVAGAPLVGFGADLAGNALRDSFVRAGMPAPDATWLDLSSLAVALAPDAQRNREGPRGLHDWLAAFGIECTIRHNAAADALAAAELLLRLRAVAATQGAQGYSALLKVAGQQRRLAGAGDD